MSQTLEELKKEVGPKVRKLSDKKILITSTIPIKVGYSTIYNYKLKSRYQINENGVYIKIWPKPRYYDIISMSWEIKKKFVYLSFHTEVCTIDGYKISGLFDKIEFRDPVWNRNWKIKEILNENI